MNQRFNPQSVILTLQVRFLTMLLSTAYGVGFEFRPTAFVQANNRLQRYFPHERHSELHGKYSDDPQLSMALE